MRKRPVLFVWQIGLPFTKRFLLFHSLLPQEFAMKIILPKRNFETIIQRIHKRCSKIICRCRKRICFCFFLFCFFGLLWAAGIIPLVSLFFCSSSSNDESKRRQHRRLTSLQLAGKRIVSKKNLSSQIGFFFVCFFSTRESWKESQ